MARKRIKRFLLCFLIIPAFLFASCSDKLLQNHVYHQGIDRFSVVDSELGICSHLIPKDFVSIFPNEEADYEYHDFGNWHIDIDVALLYFRYNDFVYEEAKQFYTENMELTDEIYPTYGSFVFYRIIGMEDTLPGQGFPRFFTMVAFSDEEKVIVAFGHYRDVLLAEPDDWATFLAGHFPFFDWDAARMMD